MSTLATRLTETRRSARERWRELPQETRRGIFLAVEAALAIALGFVDAGLGYGLATAFAVGWLPKLPPLPWRLAVEAALVAVWAYPVPALALMLAVAFAVYWLPARWRHLAIPAVVLATAIMYPFFVSKLFTIPFFGAFPSVTTGVTMLVYTMMALGLNVVVGYAGLLDLGYVAFYAIGAYTTGWLASTQFAQVTAHFGSVGLTRDTFGIHLSIWVVLLAAGVITAIFGVIIGLPTLRLRGDYLAIVTLGFGEILPQVARNGENLGGFNLTAGPTGIGPIDAPGFGNTISGATNGVLPSTFLDCCKDSVLGHQLSGNPDLFYWAAIGLLLVVVFCSLRLRDSRLGRAWIAIREDEVAAAAMGIPLMRTKTWSYATGAFFGGVAGAYYASFISFVSPGDFFFNISVFILCMVILGGMGNVWGVMIGAALLSYLNQEGLANIGSWINENLGAHIDVPQYSAGIFGLILIIVMLVRPEGLLPSARRRAELHEGVHDEPLMDVTR